MELNLFTQLDVTAAIWLKKPKDSKNMIFLYELKGGLISKYNLKDIIKISLSRFFKKLVSYEFEEQNRTREMS